MAALTQARMTREVRMKTVALPLAIGAKAYQGGIACADVAAGTVKQGQGANSNLLKLGEFADSYDNTSGSAVVYLNVSLDDEIVARAYDNDAGSPVTTSNLFQLCYLLDDHTVTMSPSGGASIAGRVLDVDSTNGVLIMAIDKSGAGGTLPLVPAAVLGAFAAGNLAPASIQQDAVYDVPTTAAASTITLPAAAPDGTRATFCADGTKNANTVQYVDATGSVNLTTALLASKRHLVIVVKEGGKWFANAYVSP